MQSRLTLQIAKLSPDESSVYVDLGYAYENDGNLTKRSRTT